ncbi:hypothetical protein GCM10010358_71860 [Streptomyces minutiscleroticus]|uniref:Uncharacterized protein n=1 Tax=Streptomyces minutiscleroticus TaxID=68238 RepID=A0A918NZJ0_9ACTN|nr:hypothetical protein GCM10010358_71860 [Streptomyces minutiscleroticus]
MLPLRVFRSRDVYGADVIMPLMVDAAGGRRLFGHQFRTALCPQDVLGYGAFKADASAPLEDTLPARDSGTASRPPAQDFAFGRQRGTPPWRGTRGRASPATGSRCCPAADYPARCRAA